MNYKKKILLLVFTACTVSETTQCVNVFCRVHTDSTIYQPFIHISDSVYSTNTTDSINNNGRAKIIANNDKTDILVKGKKLFVPSPDKAMWYGLIFPGLGQIYNRRYWKLPIVYGGFVGLAYGISWHDKYYRQYRQYYRDITDTNPDTKSYEELYSRYGTNTVTESQIKDYMDNLRRYRDLYIIGTVAFYAVTVLDAFVDASLANFDISPDLSMKLTPTMLQNYDKSVNLAIRLNVKF